MGGFKPSRADIAGSTIVGSDLAVDTHQFTGSVDITGSLTLNGSSITGGGGGGGAVSTYTNSGNNRVITSVNSNTINGEANFTFDGTDLSVSADADITSSLGRTAIGGAGLADAATVSHVDHNTATNFGFRQRANGQTEINAKSDQSINLKLGSQNKLVLNSSGFVGIGENIAPVAMLQVSSSTGLPLFRVDHPDVAHPEPILYVTGSGKVGIGTISPQESLSVSGSAAVSGTFSNRSVHTFTAIAGAIEATTGTTIIDYSSSATINTTARLGIANGTAIGQEKNLFFMIKSGSTPQLSTGITLTGSNFDEQNIFQPYTTIDLSASFGQFTQGPTYNRGSMSLIWNGTKWMIMGNRNSSIF
tara:strand:- start:1610 stop:2692 length:1083 start_codon:yes stop_codon:yes gene_type:complete